MKKFAVIGLLVAIFSCGFQAATAAPSAQSFQFSNSRTGRFIAMMYPQVVAVDEGILVNRQRIEKAYQAYLSGHQPSASTLAWLQDMAKSYRFKNLNFAKRTDWQHLLARVDIIPPSLVIAQAANESAWGRSRFAVQGNNYFGQHCYSQGCGIVPLRRNPGSRMEVKRFPNAKASIASYIHNLNTHGTYHQLRALRAQQRAKGQEVSGYVLAAGLENYSELDVYVRAIRSVIRKYSLARLDKVFA